uniref:Uncharacterized protein n=1 Tax=Strongyloides stercoralis TaxID=6248 RepID=A0AAF5I1Z8_STRER
MDCYSTETEYKAWKLLWKELEAVALLELNRKRVNFFLLGGIHLAIMLITIKNPDCCSNGTDSEALRLFWKKLEDELEAVALLELNRKRVNVFFGRNSFRINASYNSETRNSFRINASYDNESRKNSSSNNTNYNRESRHYCYCFGGCYSTGTLNLKHGSSFVKDSFNDNASFDEEHGVVLEAVVQLKLKQKH